MPFPVLLVLGVIGGIITAASGVGTAINKTKEGVSEVKSWNQDRKQNK